MKTKRANLLPVLDRIGRIANKRTTLPVLNCFLVDAKDGKLSIRGSNIDCDATEAIECEGDLSPVCLSAGKLLAFCKTDAEAVEFIPKGGADVEILANGKALFRGIKADTFPPKREGKATAIGLNTADLARAIRSVMWCADTTKARVECENISVVITDKLITTYGFSGISLARCQIASIAAPCEFLVNAAFAGGLCDALEREGAVFSVADTYVMVEHDSGTFSAALTNSEPRDFRPTEKIPREVLGSIPLAPLLDALKNCCLFAPMNCIGQIELRFGKQLEVETKFTEYQYKATIPIETGEATIPIDCHLLYSRLSQIESETVQVSVSSTPKGITFHAGDLTIFLGCLTDSK